MWIILVIFLLLSLASWITQHPATTITLCNWAFLPFAFGTGHTWTSPWEVFVGVFVRILEALHDPARGQVVKCGRRQVYISIEMLQRVGWSRNYAPAGEFLFAMGQKITLKSKRCIHTHWKETQISMQDATVSISWISQAHIIFIGDYAQGALVNIVYLCWHWDVDECAKNNCQKSVSLAQGEWFDLATLGISSGKTWVASPLPNTASGIISKSCNPAGAPNRLIDQRTAEWHSVPITIHN